MQVIATALERKKLSFKELKTFKDDAEVVKAITTLKQIYKDDIRDATEAELVSEKDQQN